MHLAAMLQCLLRSGTFRPGRAACSKTATAEEGEGGGGEWRCARGSESAHVTGAQQQQMELEEEALINKMAKRLSQLQREKQQLANAVEAEEEHISNTLQRRLALVHSALSCCPRLALACNQ